MPDPKNPAKKLFSCLGLFASIFFLTGLLYGCSGMRQVILNGPDSIAQPQGRPLTIRLVEIYRVPEDLLDLWTQSREDLVSQLKEKGYVVVNSDSRDFDATVYMVIYARYNTQSKFKYMINSMTPVDNVYLLSIDSSFLIEDRSGRPINFFQRFSGSPHSLHVSGPDVQRQVALATFREVNKTFFYTRFADIVESSLGLDDKSLYNYLTGLMEEDSLPDGMDWQVGDMFACRVLGCKARWLEPLKRSDDLYKRWTNYSFVFSDDEMTNERGYRAFVGFLEAHPSDIGSKRREKALEKLEKLNGPLQAN